MINRAGRDKLLELISPRQPLIIEDNGWGRVGREWISPGIVKDWQERGMLEDYGVATFVRKENGRTRKGSEADLRTI